MRRLLAVASLIWLAAAAPGRVAAQALPHPVFGIQGDHFTKNGTAQFLIFVSYFDALDSAAPLSDLDYFKTVVDGVRIIPNWWADGCNGSTLTRVPSATSLFTPSGGINESRWTQLNGFLNAAGDRGLMVDLTFTRETVPGLSKQAYEALIADVTGRIAGLYPHVFFDLQNEWDHPDDRADDIDVRRFARAVRLVDPNRKVTASGSYVPPDPSNPDPQLRPAPQHFLAPHHARPSDGVLDWYTFTRTNASLNGAGGDRSHGLPVHMQEPTPFNELCPDLPDPATPTQWSEAVQSAKKAGAAAWTFHTRTGFALNDSAFVLRSKTTEQNIIGHPTTGLRASAASQPWGACVYSVSPGAATLWPSTATPVGEKTVSVSVPAGCGWTASSSAPSWLSVTPSSSSGNGSVTLAATPNLSSVARSATATIAGTVTTVTQKPRAVGDFDGDGTTDVAIFRPATGETIFRQSSTGIGRSVEFGGAGDVPVPGDYDGDAKSDVAVYRPSSGHWFIKWSSTDYSTWGTYQWGSTGDMVVPADYDGDGRTDIATFTPANGHWSVLKSTGGFTAGDVRQWGQSGDSPLPGYYDIDGQADLIVYRPSTARWWVVTSGSGYNPSTGTYDYQWGSSGDVPVSGDYNGDGRVEMTVYRPSNFTWYFLKSSGYTVGEGYATGGGAEDVPAAGDFDGDGTTDLAVYRPSSSHWFIWRSTVAFGAAIDIQWGTAGDIPIVKPR